MYASRFPQDTSIPLTQQVKRGWYAPGYSKMVLFNPRRVVEMNFGPGSHKARPQGKDELRIYHAASQKSSLKLLHYKGLGKEWVLSRNAEIAARSSEDNKAQGWGFHYHLPVSYYKKKLALMRLLSYNCVDFDSHPMYRLSRSFVGYRSQ